MAELEPQVERLVAPLIQLSNQLADVKPDPIDVMLEPFDFLTIATHDADPFARGVQGVERLPAVDRRLDLIALELEQLLERIARLLLILDDEDDRFGRSHALTIPAVDAR